jgi:hypothetical protein
MTGVERSAASPIPERQEPPAPFRLPRALRSAELCSAWTAVTGATAYKVYRGRALRDQPAEILGGVPSNHLLGGHRQRSQWVPAGVRRVFDRRSRSGVVKHRVDEHPASPELEEERRVADECQAHGPIPTHTGDC